jgi:hypothetical protein
VIDYSSYTLMRKVGNFKNGRRGGLGFGLDYNVGKISRFLYLGHSQLDFSRTSGRVEGSQQPREVVLSMWMINDSLCTFDPRRDWIVGSLQ